MSTGPRTVVIVSGGDAISPFTTPERACATGQAAGSTDTALRDGLLSAGHAVYTSPANAGPGPVTVDVGFAGFADAPPQLPESMTVNAVGPIDAAGRQLAAFVAHLADTEGLDEIDIVGHSMGGLFSRAAIREMRAKGSPMRIRSLTTLGTPWTGSFAADFANGDTRLSAAGGHHGTETVMTEFARTRQLASSGAGEQVTRRYLAGSDGWNSRQSGVLAGIPVTLLAGDFFRLDGGSRHVWPHDGLVALGSAVADDVPETVLPERAARTFADVHSVYLAHAFDLPWERALTWDPEVLAAILDALAAAP